MQTDKGNLEDLNIKITEDAEKFKIKKMLFYAVKNLQTWLYFCLWSKSNRKYA